MLRSKSWIFSVVTARCARHSLKQIERRICKSLWHHITGPEASKCYTRHQNAYWVHLLTWPHWQQFPCRSVRNVAEHGAARETLEFGVCVMKSCASKYSTLGPDLIQLNAHSKSACSFDLLISRFFCTNSALVKRWIYWSLQTIKITCRQRSQEHWYMQCQKSSRSLRPHNKLFVRDMVTFWLIC